jgi:hypothetical protein
MTSTTAGPAAGGKHLIYRYNNSVRFGVDQARGGNATLSGMFLTKIN